MRRLIAGVLLMTVACGAGAADLLAPELTPGAVTLIGDSITARFVPITTWFGANTTGWVNLGVAGNTSAQVLARIGQVTTPICVLNVGINDLSLGKLSEVGPNITAIHTALAARHIQLVLSTIIPVTATFVNQPARVNAEAITLNAWIRQYGADHNLVVIDYYPAFAQPDGAGNPTLYTDAVHPNDTGLWTMVNLATRALRAAHGIL